MWAMTRSGQVVEERASWARCLYVKRDLRLRPIVGEIGEEARNCCEEDIAAEEVELLAKATSRSLACSWNCRVAVLYR